MQEPEYGSINLLKDPGFEDFSSPGVPSACYARPGGDRGATYFTDTREHHSGDHSLRLVTPEKEKGVTLRFFPVRLKAGASYSISVWAKSDPEQRNENGTIVTSGNRKNDTQMPQYVEIMMGKLLHARFVPDDQWREFVTFITIPKDTVASFRANLIMKMPGQGIAWFDDLKITEDK
jgi:hypothetical protein